MPNYPKAKFPGVVVFSEIYQGTKLYSYIYVVSPRLFSNIDPLLSGYDLD